MGCVLQFGQHIKMSLAAAAAAVLVVVAVEVKVVVVVIVVVVVSLHTPSIIICLHYCVLSDTISTQNTLRSNKLLFD